MTLFKAAIVFISVLLTNASVAFVSTSTIPSGSITGCSTSGNFTLCQTTSKTTFFQSILALSVNGIDGAGDAFNGFYLLAESTALLFAILEAARQFIPTVPS